MSNNKTNNIAIIGAGAYGCAILSALQDKKSNNITMFFKEDNDFKYVKANGRHPKMNIIFNENVKITQDLSTAILHAEYIFLVVPFCFAKSVIQEIHNILKTEKTSTEKEITIINCCKGMLNEEPFFLHKIIEETLNTKNVVVLSGASFADEMCEKKETLVNLASQNKVCASKVGNLFSDFLKTQFSKEIEATQLIGAIKNILAISNGFKTNQNSINSLISNTVLFLDEVRDIFISLKYKTDILLSSAGIGDIILTSFSSKSRNQTFGQLLSQDKKKAKDYLKNNTVEGYNATFAVFNFLKHHNIKTKYLTDIYNTLKAMEED